MRDPAKEIYDSLNAEADLQTIIGGQVENLHFDFKTKRDLTTHIVDDDLQKVLSKAISGFANADGGVIILGIDAPQGAAPTFSVIQPFALFEQEVNSYISRATSFVVQGVLIKSVAIPSNNGGVVLVYVPKSDQAPHCSMKDKKYYQRIGDSFLPMEHYQIADLFGRRHHPLILPNALLRGDINTRGKIELVLGLRNDGRAIGRFLYLKISTQAGFRFNQFGVSGNGHFGLPPFPNPTNYTEYRGGADEVIHPGTEFPVTRMDFQCVLTPQGAVIQPQGDLIIGGMLAADDFPAKNWRLIVPYQTIQNIVANPRNQSASLVGELV